MVRTYHSITRVARTISLGQYRAPHGIVYLPGDSIVAVTSAAPAPEESRISPIRRALPFRSQASMSSSTVHDPEAAVRQRYPGPRSLYRARSPGAANEALRIGPLLLPNDATPDWPTFYAERAIELGLGPDRIVDPRCPSRQIGVGQ